MMSKRNVMVLMPALWLIVATAAWAAQSSSTNPPEKAKTSGHHQMMSSGQQPMTSQHQKGAKTEEATGTIVSFTATNLVLSEKVKGKKVDRTFLLNPETKREGTLAVGAEATVNYRVENKESIATLVKVKEPTKAPKEQGQKPKY